jgi:hypothetical protein
MSYRTILALALAAAVSWALAPAAGAYGTGRQQSRPVAHAQWVRATPGVPVTITLTGTDVDGDPLTFTIVTPPAHGSILAQNGAEVTYVLDEGATSDAFVFVANDGTVSNSPPDSAHVPNGGDSLPAKITIGTAADPAEKWPNPDHTPDGRAPIHMAFGLDMIPVGGTLVIGDPLWDGPGTGAYGGMVYVIDPATGAIIRRIWNPEPTVNPWTYEHSTFGCTLANLGDDRIAVGAPNQHFVQNSAGTVWIFDLATGNLLRTIRNPAPVDHDLFGVSIAAVGEKLLIGAYLKDDLATGGPGSYLNEGRAYIYDYPSGTLTDIHNPEPGAQDQFGQRVAAGTDENGKPILCVGAYADNPDTGGGTVVADAGSVYVFEDDGTLRYRLVAPDAAPGDWFGASIEVIGGTVVVGAYGFDQPGMAGTDAGAAYIFRASDGTFLRKIAFADVQQPPPGSNLWGDTPRFGLFVRTMKVGPYLAIPAALSYIAEGCVTVAETGDVYLIDPATGEHALTIRDPEPEGDAFGTAIVGVGDSIFIAANGDHVTPASYSLDATAGSIYVYRDLLPPPRPVAEDQSLVTTRDASVAITLGGNDGSGGPASFSIVDPPAHGTLLGTPPDVTYAPDGGFAGVDRFTFRTHAACDCGDSALATVQVRVNAPPTAADDAAPASEDAPVEIDVLANDADPDGDPITVTAIVAPGQGSAAIEPGGKVLYTPAAHFHGTDAFAYIVSDPWGATATASVTVTVAHVNHAPVAANDALGASEDGAVDVAVLANDSDPDGDALAVADVTQPAHGTVSINPDGTVHYAPAAGFSGDDSFTYTASDGQGGSGTATVAVAVARANRPPTAVAQSTSGPPGASMPVRLQGTDPDGDPLSYEVIDLPRHGTLSGTAPDLVYTPEAGFHGADSFTYTVSDGRATSAPEVVTLEVAAPLESPGSGGAGGRFSPRIQGHGGGCAFATPGDDAASGALPVAALVTVLVLWRRLTGSKRTRRTT